MGNCCNQLNTSEEQSREISLFSDRNPEKIEIKYNEERKIFENQKKSTYCSTDNIINVKYDLIKPFNDDNSDSINKNINSKELKIKKEKKKNENFKKIMKEKTNLNPENSENKKIKVDENHKKLNEESIIIEKKEEKINLVIKKERKDGELLIEKNKEEIHKNEEIENNKLENEEKNEDMIKKVEDLKLEATLKNKEEKIKEKPKKKKSDLKIKIIDRMDNFNEDEKIKSDIDKKVKVEEFKNYKKCSTFDVQQFTDSNEESYKINSEKGENKNQTKSSSFKNHIIKDNKTVGSPRKSSLKSPNTSPLRKKKVKFNEDKFKKSAFSKKSK